MFGYSTIKEKAEQKNETTICAHIQRVMSKSWHAGER
jgi:hypothetical protein